MRIHRFGITYRHYSNTNNVTTETVEARDMGEATELFIKSHDMLDVYITAVYIKK